MINPHLFGISDIAYRGSVGDDLICFTTLIESVGPPLYTNRLYVRR